MNRLKGLIAVSILVFLLSATSLVVLVIDDNKDLSSRASSENKKFGIKPLEKYQSTNQDLNYNPNLWLKLEDGIFVNSKSSDTLRLVSSSYDTASISATLGKEFLNSKLLGKDQKILDDWTLERYSFVLFGENKKVNLWIRNNLRVLEVGKLNSDIVDTKEFVRSISKSYAVLSATTDPDDSAKLATLVRPSVAMVLNHYCAELKFLNAPNFPLSEKIYPFCLTSVGSGFFISSDGLLATNGHIVKNYPKSALYYGVTSGKLDLLLSDFLKYYLTQSTGRMVTEDEAKQKVLEAHKNKEVLYQLGGLIADLNTKNILKFQNEKNDYFLQTGNEAAVITDSGVKETEGVIRANLVDIDYKESNEQTGFTSSDVALLKPEKGNFPGLLMGSLEDAYVGSNLQVVGFPATAMTAGFLLDSNSLSEPTFTKGVVSSIKEAKGNQKKLIQTDAIINHGNSGGPAILLNGRVVGIATYGVTAEDGSGSYNYLRDVQDVKDLVVNKNINLSQGDIYKNWEKGLGEYWLGYFKYSKESFKKVLELYPLHPLAKKYLDSSEAKINSLEDLTPRFTVKQRSFYINISTAFTVISLLCTGVLLYLLAVQKRKNEAIKVAPTF
jgi:hypothetical protein